jgi:hypothetical protein
MALNILIYGKHREVINRVVQSFLSKLAVLKYELSLHRHNSYNTNTQTRIKSSKVRNTVCVHA